MKLFVWLMLVLCLSMMFLNAFRDNLAFTVTWGILAIIFRVTEVEAKVIDLYKVIGEAAKARIM